jgi:cyclopropane fatty-acyl-phospholipid synthase-like methyltransferase
MRTILDFPKIYNLFSKIVGGNARAIYVEKYIRPSEGDKILDIGCGTADILSFLPSVEYVGLDMNQAYINYAKNRFGEMGVFLTKKLDKGVINEPSLSDFDKVLATGVLHHLDDNEATELFELAKLALVPRGRLITLDGCYIKGQSRLASFILSKDRGKYVRTQDQYFDLASRLFKEIRVSICHDLMRIPYTHIIMECTG